MPAAARGRWCPIDRDVSEPFHLQLGLLHCATEGDPVQNLGTRRVEPVARKRTKGCGVFSFQPIKQCAVELLIDDKMTEPS